MSVAPQETAEHKTMSNPAVEPLDEHHVRMYRGSFLLFILAESISFVTLFSVRFLLAGTDTPDDLNLALGTVITLVLVLSAIPAYAALQAIRVDDSKLMESRALIAIGLGLLAMLLIIADWASSTIAPGSRFGGIYYATTVFHAIHVVAGLLFLTALWSSARRGRFSAGNHWRVEAGVRLWVFVAVSWLALYLVFYWL